MAEKRGATGKLKFDFPTHAVLEIKIKDTWYRVTPNEFRSFDGPRKYYMPKKQPDINESFTDVEFEYHDYNGPLYAYNTNLKIDKQNTGTVHHNEKWEDHQKSSKKQLEFKI